jgi:uncharacterized RDD family membrane protein YckC
MTCGHPQRQERVEKVEPPRPVAEELAGPKCSEHAGMPLLGNCPRCGRPVCVRCAPEAVRDVLTCTNCLPLSEKHQRSPQGAMCAAHASVAATFTCARCGAFACNACLAEGRGSEGLCFRCGFPVATLASRGSRFAAHLVDSVVVVGGMFVGLFIVGALDALAKGSLHAGEGGFGVFVVPVGLLATLGSFVVEIVAQVRWGQSLGKRLLGIRVVRLSGAPIELWRLILLRNVIVLAAAQLCGVLGLVDSLLIFTDDRRCLHDYIADSKVIEWNGDGPR